MTPRSCLVWALGWLVPGCYAEHERPPEPREPPIAPAIVEAPSIESLGTGWAPSLSDDGRWVAYLGLADGLPPGGEPRPFAVFVRDLVSDEVVRLAYPGDEPGVPTISGDATTLAFATATGEALVLVDRVTGVVTRMPMTRPVGTPQLSDDGARVGFEICTTDADGSGASCNPQARILDRTNGAIAAIEGVTTPYVGPATVALSGDGGTIAFEGRVAGGRDRVDTFVATAPARRARRLDWAGGYHRWTAVSDDGVRVVTELERGLDTGPPFFDRIDLVSTGVDGEDDYALDATYVAPALAVSLSGDGETVVFRSAARLADDTADPSATALYRMRLSRRAPELLTRCEIDGVAAISDDGDTIVASVRACADGSAAPATLVVIRPPR